MTPETITIDESGMTFGPYPSEHCFHIEKSALYTDIRQGVKMAEFLLLHADSDRPAMLWVVEAKSSSPRPKNDPGFGQFIMEIREKWISPLLGPGLPSRAASAGWNRPAGVLQNVRFISVRRAFCACNQRSSKRLAAADTGGSAKVPSPPRQNLELFSDFRRRPQ